MKDISGNIEAVFLKPSKPLQSSAHQTKFT